MKHRLCRHRGGFGGKDYRYENGGGGGGGRQGGGRQGGGGYGGHGGHGGGGRGGGGGWGGPPGMTCYCSCKFPNSMTAVYYLTFHEHHC